MQDLITIDSRNTKSRLVLAGAIVFSIVFCWFAIRWQIGSMLADLTVPENPEARSVADLAISLAPADPVARWLRASIEIGDPAAKLLEETVRRSPGDYRWRIELGRAYEQDDKPELAEKQFKKAVELAPTYAFARWHLGNFYLRQGRTDEAFAELRKAAENNQTYREQVFSLAWDYFAKDAAKVEQLAADTTDAKANLALFFAARARAADALRIWNLLTEEEKNVNPQIARSIAKGLFIQRAFPQALEFGRQQGSDAEAAPEAITNPGFERLISSQDESQFDWKVNRSDAKLDVAADSTTRHQGSRSLRVSFRNYVKPELYNIFQIVVVEPGQKYRLSFWVRTENLKSAGGPLLEIVNANDDKLVAASKPFDTGTNDWKEYSLEIKVPDNCSGITIRTARAFCGEQCPIAGTLWYDDFDLRKM